MIRHKHIQMWLTNHYPAIKTTLITVLVLIVLAVLGLILFNIRNQAAETNSIAQDVKTILCEDTPVEECDLEQAVETLLNNQDQNTLLLCKVIRQGDSNNLSSEDEREIERICQRELRRSRNNGQASQTTTSGQTQPQGNTSPTPTRNQPRRNPNPAPPPPPEEEPNTVSERGVARCLVQALPGGEDPCAIE